MLIELEGPALPPGPTPARLRAALANLALAHREGKHLLFAFRKLAIEISGMEALSQDDRATYSEIGQQFGTRKATRDAVARRVIVTWGLGEAVVVEGDDRNLRYRVPFGYFADSARVQETVLAVENHPNDTGVYHELARLGAVRDLGGGCIAFHPQSCVGNQFLGLWLPWLEQRRLTIAVVDSDKTSATSPLGDTARLAAQAFDGHEGVAELDVLPVRELENILPPALWLEVFASDPDLGAKVVSAGARFGEGGRPFEDLGLPKSCLPRIAAALGHLSPGKLKELLLRPPSHPELDRLCAVLAAWGLALPRCRT